MNSRYTEIAKAAGTECAEIAWKTNIADGGLVVPSESLLERYYGILSDRLDAAGVPTLTYNGEAALTRAFTAAFQERIAGLVSGS